MKDITHQKEANMEVDISDIKPEMKNNVNNCLHDSTDEKKVAIRLCKTGQFENICTLYLLCI